MSTFVGARNGTDNLALATGYNALDRDFRRQLGMKVPKYSALSIMRELQGRMEPLEKTKEHAPYFWEEGDWFNASVTIAAVDNGTPGQTTITLSTDDHFDSGSKSYPIVNNLCIFETEVGGFAYSINRSAPNAHTVVIKPTNADQDVQAAAIVGTKVMFYGYVAGEASDTPETRTPFVSKITNTIHTSRGAYKVTDWSSQNEVEFEYEGQKYLYVKGLEESADRFRMEEDLNLILTPQIGTLVDAAGNTLKSANGMIPQITTNGQSLEYYDEPDLAFFQETVLQMADNYGDNEYWVGQGKNFSLGTDNWLVDFTRGGDNRISYNAFDGGQQQAVKFDFKSISLGGVTMHFQTWDVFTHKNSMGAGDMRYRNMAIGIPTGSGMDGETRQAVPYMRLRYSSPMGADFEVQGDVKIFEHGGASKRGATSGVQTRTVEHISYKTLEIRNREKFFIARKGN
jgi:hypothetical protein